MAFGMRAHTHTNTCEMESDKIIGCMRTRHYVIAAAAAARYVVLTKRLVGSYYCSSNSRKCTRSRFGLYIYLKFSVCASTCAVRLMTITGACLTYDGVRAGATSCILITAASVQHEPNTLHIGSHRHASYSQ